MKRALFIASLCVAALLPVGPSARAADSAKAVTLDREARAALKNLYATVPAAKALGEKSVAVLVFPGITKAGLMVGGQYGEGALIRGGKTVGYFSSTGVSYGLQAGIQKYAYAMIFMKESALKQLYSNEGFEVGVGPSVVVVDEGMAKSVTTKTMDKDIYAFIFGQKGLMAGLGVQGNKIAGIKP